MSDFCVDHIEWVDNDKHKLMITYTENEIQETLIIAPNDNNAFFKKATHYLKGKRNLFKTADRNTTIRIQYEERAGLLYKKFLKEQEKLLQLENEPNDEVKVDKIINHKPLPDTSIKLTSIVDTLIKLKDDELFGLKLNLFEHKSVQASKNRTARAGIRKSKNGLEALYHYYSIVQDDLRA